LPSHHSSEENASSDDGLSDYSPPWSSEKEDPEKEDEDENDTDTEPKTMTTTLTMTLTLTPTLPCLLPSERGEHARGSYV
jgi:hypothetical protein